MINGALASSDQLGNFGVSMGDSVIPPSYQLPPTGAGAGRERKRESLFSETSTELSVDDDHVQPEERMRRESLYSESSGESASGNRANPSHVVPGGGARGRSRNESVFSETSTELSGSSTPGNWDVVV
jgi:hypothetical protein